MINPFTDTVLIMYLISLAVNLYGASLFSWWWMKSGKASFVYMCITVLFVGSTIEDVIHSYARLMRLGGDLSFTSGASVLWIYKGSISIIASFFVVCYLTLRVLGGLNPSHLRRTGDAGHNKVCRGISGEIVHEMAGPVIYYKCLKCGQEWVPGDKGYEQAGVISRHEEE